MLYRTCVVENPLQNARGQYNSTRKLTVSTQSRPTTVLYTKTRGLRLEPLETLSTDYARTNRTRKSGYGYIYRRFRYRCIFD